MSAVSGAGAANAAQHAQASASREAASTEQRALNASQYHGTVFGYGTGTAQSQGAHQASVRAQQLQLALARRRRQLRRGAAGDVHGEGNVDEPGGVEVSDKEVDGAAKEHRDAAHQGRGRPAPAPAAGGHGAPAARRKRKDGDRVEGDDEGAGDEHGDGVDADRGDARGGGSGGGGGGGDQHGGGRGDGERGGGGGGGSRGSGGALLRGAAGTALPRPFDPSAQGARKALDVKVGPAIARQLPGVGPIERLAATLPRGGQRDAKLHEAHFRRHWDLRERALANPGVNYHAEAHAIEGDWQRTLARHGPVQPESGAELRERLVDAQRRGGQPPRRDPARSPRTSSINLLFFLTLLDGQAPSFPLRRQVAIDTRTAQGRMSQLGQLLARKPGKP